MCLLFGYKDHCAVDFLKGALLHDVDDLLASPGANSQAMRMMKFTSVQQIDEMEPILRDFIQQAIEIDKAGLKIDFKEKDTLVFSDELVDFFW